MATLETLLASVGFASPTPVQAAVWEPWLAHRDLVVQAETGSGKTLAYLLPLTQTIDPATKDLQTLILVPTQELAVQIQGQLDLVFAGGAVRHLLLMGGVNLFRQLEMLKSKPHVVVGTPGRVQELLEKKKITGHFLRTVVLDEADRLLDGPSVETVRAILKTTLKTRQLALFSASIPRAAELTAAAWLKDPVVLRLDAAAPIPDTIAHWSFVTEQQQKADLLRKILHSLDAPRTMVFLNNPDQIEVLAAKLRHHGVAAESLHGSLFKNERKRAMEAFSKGEVTVLVASDLAARGLDFGGVTHVVHFDIPEKPLDYQHRCGRTGRAGQSGLSIALATEFEMGRLHEVEKSFKIRISAREIHHGNIQDAKR